MRLVTRTFLAAVLVGTGLLKVLGAQSPAVFPVWFLKGVGVCEIGLALVIASRWWPAAIMGLLGIVTVGGGILVWRLLSGNTSASTNCGCLGPVKVPLGAYASLLTGTALLSILAMTDWWRERRANAAREPATMIPGH